MTLGERCGLDDYQPALTSRGGRRVINAMNKQVIVLDGVTFRTKRDAVEFFRRMLGKYALDQTVTPDDQRLLTALVARHRHADDLLSRPIAAFRVVKGELYGNSRRFEIVRDDGSVNEFSYLKCISPPSDGHRDDVLWAFRCDVIDQTRAFHDTAFSGASTVACAITGKPVKRSDSHVDHAPPLTFQVVAYNFLTEIGLRIQDVAVTLEGHLDSCAAKYLADRELAARWQEYHRRHARLRITSKKANLTQKKQKVDFSNILLN